MTDDYIDFLPPEEKWADFDGVKVCAIKGDKEPAPLSFYFEFPDTYNDTQQQDFIDNMMGIIDSIYKDIGGDEIIVGKSKKVFGKRIENNPN